MVSRGRISRRDGPLPVVTERADRAAWRAAELRNPTPVSDVSLTRHARTTARHARARDNRLRNPRTIADPATTIATNSTTATIDAM